MVLQIDYEELLTGENLQKIYNFDDFKQHIIDFNEKLKTFEREMNTRFDQTLKDKVQNNKNKKKIAEENKNDELKTQEDNQIFLQNINNNNKKNNKSANTTPKEIFANQNDDDGNVIGEDHVKENDDTRNDDTEEQKQKTYNFDNMEEVESFLQGLYQQKYKEELKNPKKHMMDKFQILFNFVNAYKKKFKELDVVKDTNHDKLCNMKNNISNLTVDNYDIIEKTINKNEKWSAENSYFLEKITSNIIKGFEMVQNDVGDDNKKKNKDVSTGYFHPLKMKILPDLEENKILLKNTRTIMDFNAGGFLPSDGIYKSKDGVETAVEKGQFMKSDGTVVTLEEGEIGTTIGWITKFRLGEIATEGNYMQNDGNLRKVTQNDFMTKDKGIVTLEKWQLGTNDGEVWTFNPNSKLGTINDETKEFAFGLIPKDGYFKEDKSRVPIQVYKGSYSKSNLPEREKMNQYSYNKVLRLVIGDYILKDGKIGQVTVNQTGMLSDGKSIIETKNGGRSRSRPSTSRGTKKKNQRN
jgi:hypothetical protein